MKAAFCFLKKSIPFVLIELNFPMSWLPFNKILYAKVLVAVAIAVVATFAIAIYFFDYELTNADPGGSLIATPLAAYLVHLWLLKDE
jgi:hypothetical protein